MTELRREEMSGIILTTSLDSQLLKAFPYLTIFFLTLANFLVKLNNASKGRMMPDISKNKVIQMIF